MPVNRLNLAIGVTLIFAFTPARATQSKTTAELVYRVDRVTAATEAGRIVVTAWGAVRSGGWTDPHLRPTNSRDGHVATFEFVAVPPAPDAAVIEVLIPVEAQMSMPSPRVPIGEVRVEAETNATTATVAIAGPDNDSSTPSERLPVIHGEQ